MEGVAVEVAETDCMKKNVRGIRSFLPTGCAIVA